MREDDLVYVDESGIDTFLHRTHGWAKRGKEVMGEVSGKRFARESFVAGLCAQKVLAPFCYQGTCNSDLFNMWIQDFLVPDLKPGQVVIWDNATFHKSEKTRHFIEKAGCQIIFLPPYSPDLNPIEIFWANLKAKIKQIIKSSQSLQQAIDHAFNAFTPQVE